MRGATGTCDTCGHLSWHHAIDGPCGAVRDLFDRDGRLVRSEPCDCRKYDWTSRKMGTEAPA